MDKAISSMKQTICAAALASVVVLVALGPAMAQAPEPPTFNFLEQLDPLGLGISGGDGNQMTLSGQYTLVRGANEGHLSIKAVIAPSWHVYSLTQMPGGPMKSEIAVESDQIRLSGQFFSDQPPHIKHYDFFPVPVEEHSGTLTWTASIQVPDASQAENLAMKITFSGQVCQDDGVCIPINRSVTTTFAGYTEPKTTAEEYRDDETHVTIFGSVTPATVLAGGKLQLTLNASPDPGWHVYGLDATDSRPLTKATLIVLNLPDAWRPRDPVASAEPEKVETGLEEQPFQYYYESEVQWTVPIDAPADAKAGEYKITGWIGYQTCTSAGCDLPTAAEFSATIKIGDEASGDVRLVFEPSKYARVAQLAEVRAEQLASTAPNNASLDLNNLAIDDKSAETPFALVMLTAFVAGFILNFMPCVLPVIGLKVMAFVQQSGDSRGRVFMLNLWYCIGLMSVFMVLATLAVFAGLGWGQQFSSAGFNIILASVVFAFALSFLGIWEIPIPGFVGSGKVGDLATKEGASGAFFKGVLTTVLATPCSGPLLSPALTWAVGQPPLVAYLGFGAVGMGMASPYLLIGAFPKLVAFLPKPGAWMDTFKHIMGFVLLGTVVFLMTFMPVQLVVPTVAFMMGLWAALWWIGRVPVTAPGQAKVRAWASACAFVAIIGLVSFNWLDGVMERRFLAEVDRLLAERNSGSETVSVADVDEDELPWQSFSFEALEQLTSEGRTVFVDFTADW
jgi:thiol:disulfide interchange protein